MQILRQLKQIKWVVVRYTVFCWFFKRKKVVTDTSTKPLWVFGMFRSGTSLTSEILLGMNTSFGPESHLLKPIGKLKDLNPNGFFENYVFAEYSRYFLAQINASGDSPPEDKLIDQISFQEVNERKLFAFSIQKIKEDRISISDKYKSFVSLRKLGLNRYVTENFGSKPVIKIPLLSFFYKPILKVWPNSVVLIVFRHPVSTIKSSQVLTKQENFDLYKAYYTKLLELSKHKDVYFFSYDNLIQHPYESITVLNKIFNLEVKEEKIKELTGKIDPALIRNRPMDINEEETEQLYMALNNLAINKINHEKINSKIPSEEIR